MSDTPDFDKMSPEELMKWMETLAKRQGAYEGFTTSADMQVAEIDPDSVVIDEPGYVPYGQENKKPEPAKPTPAAAAPKPATVPAPTPAAAPPPPVAAAPAASAPAASAETPDFDKMSPEEIMKWMETLAKRQGAYEGFTTSADMEVGEIDPDTVVIDEPGYVPFEGKEPKRSADAPAIPTKPAPAAAKPTPAPAPIPVAPQPVASPPPTPEVVPAASAPAASGDTPDFDKMSPEEIMKWMETLAKRQGAYEGFTTTADMDVAEVDPNSVVIDEPGYVPFEGKEPKRASTAPAMPTKPTPVEKPAAPAPIPVAPPPTPVAEPVASLDLPTTGGQDALDWLEKLATEPANELPSFDLSGLGELPTASIPEPTDTLGWLEGLAAGGVADLGTPEPAAVPAGDDPMAWLENLARKQGADADEMTTPADAQPEFSLDNILAQADAPAESALPVNDDPSAWLDSLAEQRSSVPHQPAKAETPAPNAAAAAKAESQDIMSALNTGKDVAPDDIANMFAKMMNIAAERDDVEDYTYDDEEAEAEPEEPLQPEIPDWLRDSAPVAQMDAPTSMPPLDEVIAEPPAVDDMPDWLKEEAVVDDTGMENIFAPVSSPPPSAAVESPVTSVPSTVKEEFLNTDDQWIETFELEYIQRTGGTVEASSAPTPTTTAPTPAVPVSGGTDLPEETELPAGEPAALPDWLLSAASSTPAVSGEEAVPDWLSTSADQPVSLDWITDDQAPEPLPTVEATPTGDLPDWLVEANVETPDVPDWLLETIGEKDQAIAMSTPAPEPAPTPTSTAPTTVVPVVSAPRPVPTPVRAGFPAAAVDVSGALASARQKVTDGDIDGSIVDYESVVRAGGDLSGVLDDLRSMMSRNPNNPAVYRVLGDGLMRSGKLQEALDTYRKALNLL
jgi:uncharacterized membrane protein